MVNLREEGRVGMRVIADNVPVHCAYDELADITMLVPNPRNPNQHPQKQIELLAKIIKNQGWRAPITVSTCSGFVVRGHGRSTCRAARIFIDSLAI